MDALDAIFTRHSISHLQPDSVPQELVEKLLAAAVQAPNHHRVRPWRLVVLQGKARERLGDVFAQSMAENYPDLAPAALDKERAKPLRAPLLIAVGVDLPEDPRVNLTENICAAAAACENILLAAHALGLAGMWRTGAQATDPRVKSFLGLSPEQPLIAFLYMGTAAGEPAPYERPAYADRTTWLAD